VASGLEGAHLLPCVHPLRLSRAKSFGPNWIIAIWCEPTSLDLSPNLHKGETLPVFPTLSPFIPYL
jgi:hypothetical protein